MHFPSVLLDSDVQRLGVRYGVQKPHGRTWFQCVCAFTCRIYASEYVLNANAIACVDDDNDPALC